MQPRRSQDWKHLAAMGIVTAIISAALAYFFLHIDFIPFPSSTQRGMIDSFVKVLFGIAGIILGVIATAFVYSLLFFRRKAGDLTDGPPVRGNSRLEIIWTIIPLLIVIGLSVQGAIVLNRMTAPPPVTQSELTVNVTAFRFGWQFAYPEYGVQAFELEVPVNRPIHFYIQSKDVIHSFWVQQWGPKQDAVPGLITELRIMPDTMGDFQVQCSQLCGYGHTYMLAPVHVVSASDFQTWVGKQEKITPAPTPSPTQKPSPGPTTPTPATTFGTLASQGQSVYATNCAACHGNNGQGVVGPALWGPNATLGTFAGTTLFAKNAGAMLDFISTRMPLNAPGSLSHEQYIDALGYILVQGNQVSASTTFNEGQLGSIPLK